jgi:MoaA/NifB/PqqE/SkfB family radical SAM enzyme
MTSTYRLISRLISNGVRYKYLKLFGLPAAPEALSMEVTHRCIARCMMCNIWKIPAPVADLPSSDWLNLLDRPVFRHLKELDVTGGEPFLRDDLSELMRGVCMLKASTLPELRSVAITTNGFLTNRVVAEVRVIADEMKKAGLDLVVVFAMDAVGEIHDRIRNVKNGWQRLARTIDGVKAVRRDFGNVIIGLKTTILPVNVNELNRIARFADENGLFTIISPCIITAGRYDNEDLRKNLEFGQDDVQKMIGFYEGQAFQWSYHRRTLLQLLKNGGVQKPCSAGFNYFFVRSTGDVYPCPLVKTTIGNFNDEPFEALVASRPARLFRRSIGTFTECRTCSEPGLERYALPLEGFHYLKLFAALGRKDFLDFHAHMGLDKYI